jgi:hypothetical protein
MSAQNTRLELAIVAAALLVLLLCRQPPKSGNAGTVKGTEPTLQQPVLGPENGGQKTQGDEIPRPVPAAGDLQTQSVQSFPIGRSSDDVTPDNTTRAPQSRMKPIGVVDATQCKALNYKDVMFGEITAQWVWDGQKEVLRKVCRVKEKDGTISIWTFDDRDDIVLSQLQPEAGGE